MNYIYKDFFLSFSLFFLLRSFLSLRTDWRSIWRQLGVTEKIRSQITTTTTTTAADATTTTTTTICPSL